MKVKLKIQKIKFLKMITKKNKILMKLKIVFKIKL